MPPTRRASITGVALLLVGPVSFASTRGGTSSSTIPPGYALIADEFRIPAAVLYGVALQESVLPFGKARERRLLPWPWTLNIAGQPARFATRAAAEDRLRAALRAGVDSVDIGPMGINWRFHKHRLGSVERSLDPYWNLRVGAGLLAGLYATSGSWTVAVGRYHSPGNKQRAANYSAHVFQRLKGLGHAGLDHA